METKNQLAKVQKANDDFVRSLSPTTTKTVKNFIGKEKEVPKTDEERQRDREVLAAQAVLRDKDEVDKEKKLLTEEREEIQADREEMARNALQQEAQFRKEKAEMREDFEKQLAEKTDELKAENTSLKAENNTLKDKIRQFQQQFQQQAKSMAIAVAIRARKSPSNDRFNKFFYHETV